MSFSKSILARALHQLAEAVCQYPWWFVYPQIVLSVLCVLYTIHGLKLDMDRDNLVGTEVNSRQIYLRFRQEFPGEDLLVLVESEKW